MRSMKMRPGSPVAQACQAISCQSHLAGTLPP